MLDKIKDNLVVSVVSTILTGASVFVGSTFIGLQESNSELVERAAGLESTIREAPDTSAELNKVVENSTIITFLEKEISILQIEIRNLRERVRKLEQN